MSTSNDQDTTQAPAPFAVGDKVRCVSELGAGGYLRENVVYEVAWCGREEVSVKGVPPNSVLFTWMHRYFHPAVPYDAPDGTRWLVVDERVPDVDKDVWVDLIGQVNTPEFGFRQSDTNTNGGRRRILAEWVEFPAPEAKAEPVVEDWQLRCAHAETELEIMRQERDSLRARVSELERFLAIADENTTNHLRKIEELKAAPIPLTDIARSISAHYPDAEVVIVKVVRDGSLVFAPTTEAALAGKEAK